MNEPAFTSQDNAAPLQRRDSASLRPAGFTLLEFLVVMAILSILAGLAIPSFNQFISSSNQAAAVNDLSAALQLARSESNKRGQSVVVCPANTAANGCASNWQGGWIVFVNRDADTPPAVDAGEEVLDRVSPTVGQLQLQATTTAFVFRPFGNRSDTGQVAFCSPLGSARARIVEVKGSGYVALRNNTAGSITCA